MPEGAHADLRLTPDAVVLNEPMPRSFARYRSARDVAWTGATTVPADRGTDLWMSRLGPALHCAMQGFGSVVLIVAANGVRLLASAAGARIAIYWLGLGAIGFFAAVAIGFCAFAAMAVDIMLGVKEAAVTPL